MTEEKDKILISVEPGDKVRHPRWGLGSVIYKYGSGDKTKVIVLFEDDKVGQKKLMLKYANLTKA